MGLNEVGRIAVPVHPAAGWWRRVALPAALAMAAWYVLWMADNICLRRLAGWVDVDAIWPQVPALVLLPRFGWLFFPVLLLCIHLCARGGGGAIERTVVSLAPAAVAPFVYWRSLDGSLDVTLMWPGRFEDVGVYGAKWSIYFFAPEYVAMVLTCISAVVIYTLAPRVRRSAASSPKE